MCPRGWVPVAAALAVAGWGANQFTPLAAVYRTQEGWSDVPLAAMFTTYLLGLLPGLLLGGQGADRWGRRRVVRTALPVCAAASVLLATAVVSSHTVYASRLVTGLAAGVILAAGATWLEELSAGRGPDVGARRALYATGGGFAAGAVSTGVLVEWLPHPMVAACLVHGALALLVLAATVCSPETLPPRQRGGARVRPPRARWSIVTHPRFVLVVLPASPAALAAATVAYVVLPPLVLERVHGHAPLFSGLAAGVTIGTGVAVQPLARWLDHAGSARSTLVAMATVVLGLLTGAGAVVLDSAVLVLIAALVLGAGYGLTLASGLKEVERLQAHAGSPAGRSLYHGATHTGFVTPLLLAVTAGAAPYPALLVVLAALGLLFLAVTAVHSRRHLPAPPVSH